MTEPGATTDRRLRFDAMTLLAYAAVAGWQLFASPPAALDLGWVLSTLAGLCCAPLDRAWSQQRGRAALRTTSTGLAVGLLAASTTPLVPAAVTVLALLGARILDDGERPIFEPAGLGLVAALALLGEAIYPAATELPPWPLVIVVWSLCALAAFARGRGTVLLGFAAGLTYTLRLGQSAPFAAEALLWPSGHLLALAIVAGPSSAPWKPLRGLIYGHLLLALAAPLADLGFQAAPFFSWFILEGVVSAFPALRGSARARTAAAAKPAGEPAAQSEEPPEATQSEAKTAPAPGADGPPRTKPRASVPLNLALAAAVSLIAVWATLSGHTKLGDAALAVALASALVLPIASGAPARSVWFNVAIAASGLVALESYLANNDRVAGHNQAFGDSTGLFVVNDTLGVRPTPGLQTWATLHHGDELIYETVYTFDANGLRIAPPLADDEKRPCVLFFGGSFTLGEGVRDDETLPYRVGTLSGGAVDVRNFGFFGYGPHQMLAAIESGFAFDAASCDVRTAVYQTHPHHILRAAGLWAWDRNGPRYLLTQDGYAVRAGNFSKPRAPEIELGADQDSALARRWRRQGMVDLAPTDAGNDDIGLYHAIVRTSFERLRDEYPNVAFHVLYWNESSPPLFAGDDAIDGITVHDVTEILPPSDDWERTYKFPHDVHPKASTYELLARYVVDKIVTTGDDESTD